MNNRHRQPWVLTGFMCAGKTCVGRKIAEKLGWEFCDMDAIIEADERMSVREIFETRGEAYFRAREAEWCARLARREQAVIATGGGALVAERNRAAFARALVVCLDASPDEIAARLGSGYARPLLDSGDARERIERLMNERRAAYGAIARHIDTTGKTIEQVAAEVMGLLDEELGAPCLT